MTVRGSLIADEQRHLLGGSALVGALRPYTDRDRLLAASSGYIYGGTYMQRCCSDGQIQLIYVHAMTSSISALVNRMTANGQLDGLACRAD